MSSASLGFRVETRDGQARAGWLSLRGQEIQTPVFMPVGTHATVKALTSEELQALGYRLILANTYHLHLRPGDDVIRRLGGLHRFMHWDRGLLTDSGGFQIFSLGGLNRVVEEGVHFQSHLDGSRKFLTPESAIAIQENLGSDIMMVLDECLPIPVAYETAARSVARTTRWARRCLAARRSDNHLFAIVQGADFPDLRLESALGLMETDFDGFAIGGLSVGESRQTMQEVLSQVGPVLPEDKPRYLMGVGDPRDLLNAVAAGVDMFDCVLPTRNARNGCLFTFKGKIAIKQACYRDDPEPIEEDCGCEVCRHYSRAYLRHLFKSNEILASRLNSYHNLWFFRELMSRTRHAISEGRFSAFKDACLATYSASSALD